jgi:hypothetical protein
MRQREFEILSLAMSLRAPSAEQSAKLRDLAVNISAGLETHAEREPLLALESLIFEVQLLKSYPSIL